MQQPVGVSTTVSQSPREESHKPLMDRVKSPWRNSRAPEEIEAALSASKEELEQTEKLIQDTQTAVSRIKSNLDSEDQTFTELVKEIQENAAERGSAWALNKIDTLPSGTRARETYDRHVKALKQYNRRKSELQSTIRNLELESHNLYADTVAQSIKKRFEDLVELVEKGREIYKPLLQEVSSLKQFSLACGRSGSWNNKLGAAGVPSWAISAIDTHLSDLTPRDFIGWLFKMSRISGSPLQDSYIRNKVPMDRGPLYLGDRKEYYAPSTI